MSGLIVGCSTENLVLSESNSVPTHKQVNLEHKKRFGIKPLLLVGIKPYLGRETTDLKPAQGLLLQTVGKPLILKDAKGVVHKSEEINIAWRKVNLSIPQTFSRQVAGPFASFESAQRLSEKLQDKGLQAVVAHPQDWEVWIPRGAKLPEEIDVVAWDKTINSEIKPYLKGLSGEILLSGPIKIEAPDGLHLDGGIFSGPFWLQPDAYGSWTLVEQVPLQRYLNGVVPYEIGSSAPPEALAAQAVLARTWALANRHRFAIDGYHLCSDTQCQVYKDPSKANQLVKDAINKTAGKYLSWKKKPIHAVYHASNGGVMASGTEAWSMTPVPYLRAQLDGSKQWTDLFALPLNTNQGVRDLLRYVDGAYGTTHSRFRWKRTIDAGELKNVLDVFKYANTFPSQVKVLERGDSGRVLALEILSKDNQFRRVLRLDEIRRVLRDLPSTLFVVNELKEGLWQFSGGGFGHGAGLSQAGAIDLALRGWNASQILRHYYPGTTYGTLQDLPKAP